MLKVFKTCCKNCLLSVDSIVSPSARKEIIQECLNKQTHFICHKATMNGEETICATFYEKLGHHSQMVRIAERMRFLEFIEQVESEKLPTYKEMNP